MSKNHEPEMSGRALRMLTEAVPDHPNRSSALRHVPGLAVMNPDTLREWQRSEEVDARQVKRVSTGEPLLEAALDAHPDRARD